SGDDRRDGTLRRRHAPCRPRDRALQRGRLARRAVRAAMTALAPEQSEPRWPSSLAVLAAIVLYVFLPSGMIAAGGTPAWSVPLLELGLLVPLAATTPHRHVRESGRRRRAAIALTAVVSAANLLSLALLVR